MLSSAVFGRLLKLELKAIKQKQCIVEITTRYQANRRKKGLVFFVGIKFASLNFNQSHSPLPPTAAAYIKL